MEGIIESIGQPSSEHLSYARKLLDTLPEELKQAAHNPFSARAVIYYLILDKQTDIREQQFNYLKEKADTGIYDETIKLIDAVPEIYEAYRLSLIEISLSSLRQLSMRQYFLFKDNLNTLIEMDNKINLFEWSLQKIVFHHLGTIYEKPKQKKQKKSLTKFKNECSILLSFLIHAGKQDDVSADDVFETAKNTIGISDIALVDRKALSLTELNLTLDKLKTVKPLLKPKLLKACATCITADNKITMTEIELFRAIADVLDCPMPPLQV